MATNPLNTNRQSTGMVGLQQAVRLPPAGTEVEFTVYVLDSDNHASNQLSAVFVSPA
jgi:hypothetical protein